MAQFYSNCLGKRAVLSAASARPCRDAASLFGVSLASVVEASQRHWATGSAAAWPKGGRCVTSLQSAPRCSVYGVSAITA